MNTNERTLHCCPFQHLESLKGVFFSQNHCLKRSVLETSLNSLRGKQKLGTNLGEAFDLQSPILHQMVALALCDSGIQW